MVDTGSAETGPVASGEVGHYGVSVTGLTIGELTIATAWNVQGDATQPDFFAEVRRLFDMVLPTAPNTVVRSDALTALWLGPASWLLVAGGASSLTDFAAKRDALNRFSGALFDVSAARIAWALSGPHATDVLAKGCPLDFHPRAFSVGACAQSVHGQIHVLIEKRDEAPTFTLMAPRSFAHDIERTFAVVAAQYGFDVLAPRPYA